MPDSIDLFEEVSQLATEFPANYPVNVVFKYSSGRPPSEEDQKKMQKLTHEFIRMGVPVEWEEQMLNHVMEKEYWPAWFEAPWIEAVILREVRQHREIAGPLLNWYLSSYERPPQATIRALKFLMWLVKNDIRRYGQIKNFQPRKVMYKIVTESPYLYWACGDVHDFCLASLELVLDMSQAEAGTGRISIPLEVWETSADVMKLLVAVDDDSLLSQIQKIRDMLPLITIQEGEPSFFDAATRPAMVSSCLARLQRKRKGLLELTEELKRVNEFYGAVDMGLHYPWDGSSWGVAVDFQSTDSRDPKAFEARRSGLQICAVAAESPSPSPCMRNRLCTYDGRKFTDSWKRGSVVGTIWTMEGDPIQLKPLGDRVKLYIGVGPAELDLKTAYSTVLSAPMAPNTPA